MPRRPEALSLVERGWRGAREWSRQAGQQGITVTHVIKGWVSKDVRVLVTPLPLVRTIWMPRRCFRVAAWWLLLGRTLTGRLRWVLVDHERTARELKGWCRLFRVSVVRISDAAGPRV